MPKGLSLKKILKDFKQMMSCNGHIKDENIILQGDHREVIKDFLIKNNIALEKNIVVHGF